MKELMTDKITDCQFVNQVKIEFTSKSITAWGGLGVLIGKFLEKIEFRDWVEGHIPIEETSNNSGGIYEEGVKSIYYRLRWGLSVFSFTFMGP